jgi:hypothetical protein
MTIQNIVLNFIYGFTDFMRLRIFIYGFTDFTNFNDYEFLATDLWILRILRILDDYNSQFFPEYQSKNVVIARRHDEAIFKVSSVYYDCNKPINTWQSAKK